jgi:hypothetical protein
MIGGAQGDLISGGSAFSTFIDGSKGNQSIIGSNSGVTTIWGALAARSLPVQEAYPR